MAVQRNRLVGAVTTPDRQVIRKALTTFQEGTSPEALASAGPARIGDVSASRIVVADADGPRTQMVSSSANGGLRWMDPTDQIIIGSLREASFFDGSALIREGVWSLDDVSGVVGETNFGTDVGRRGFFRIDNFKIPGSESTSSANNKVYIDMEAKVNSSRPTAVIAILADNDVNKITIQGDLLMVAIEPDANSRYARGGMDYQEQTVAVDISSGAVCATTAPILTRTGRRYKITAGWWRITNTATPAFVEMSIREQGGSTFRTIRLVLSASATWGDGGMVSAVVTPSAGTHTYELYGAAVAGGGTDTVQSGSGASAIWILVEDIGVANF